MCCYAGLYLKRYHSDANDRGTKALYYPKFEHFYIDAEDYVHHFQPGIDIDTSSSLNNYILGANSSNSALLWLQTRRILSIGQQCVTLTAFDTTQRKISCNFQLACYGSDRDNKKLFPLL